MTTTAAIWRLTDWAVTLVVEGGGAKEACNNSGEVKGRLVLPLG